MKETVSIVDWLGGTNGVSKPVTQAPRYAQRSLTFWTARYSLA